MQLYSNRFDDSKNTKISRRIQLNRTRNTFHSVTLQSKIQKDKKKHRKEDTWFLVSHHLTEHHTGGSWCHWTLGAFLSSEGTGSPSDILCGAKARTIRCVRYKQRKLGCQALREAKQLDRSFGGCSWYSRGNLSISHRPPPTMPAPTVLTTTREWNTTPWRDDLEAIPLPEKGRASLCCSDSWVFEATLLASLLPTPNHRDRKSFFLFNIYLFAVPGPSMGSQGLHRSVWGSSSSGDMWDLVSYQGLNPGPCVGGMESQPLDH